jgi:amino acid transporter
MLARTHQRHGSPYVGSLAQTGATVALIALFALAGADPVLMVFPWMSGLATVSILVLMVLTAMAITVFFRRRPVDARLWNTRIGPVLGLLGLVFLTVLVLANFTTADQRLRSSTRPGHGPPPSHGTTSAIFIELPSLGVGQPSNSNSTRTGSSATTGTGSPRRIGPRAREHRTDTVTSTSDRRTARAVDRSRSHASSATMTRFRQRTPLIRPRAHRRGSAGSSSTTPGQESTSVSRITAGIACAASAL